MKFEEGKVGMEVVVRNAGCSVPVGSKGVIKELARSRLFYVDFYNNISYTLMYPDNFNIVSRKEFPTPFIIKGEMHHLNAFAEDLEKMGYTISQKTHSKGSLRLNGNCIKSHGIEIWKQVCYSTNLEYKTYVHTPTITHQEFSLPTQWNEALECAKEFIEHPFWNKKKEEILDIKHADRQSFQVKVSDTISYQEVNPSKIIFFDINELEQYYNLAINNKISGLAVQFPTISIGCKKDIKITEIKRIIDTYKKLNS